MVVEIILILVLVVLNGIFSGTELALVSAKRGRLQQRADDGDHRAATALSLQANPNRLLATVQVGITLIGTLTGVFGGASIAERIAPLLAPLPLIGPVAETAALALVVILITYLSLVIGELAPKRLALRGAEGIALTMARPMDILSRISSPLIAVLSWSTNALLVLLGQRGEADQTVTEEDIRLLLREGMAEGAVEAQEHQIIERVFDLGDRRVRQVMTPRQRVKALSVDTPLDTAVTHALEVGFSRFPVYEQVLDHVVGAVHIRDLIELARGDGASLTVRAAMRPAVVVPELSPAADLLPTFRKARQHLAVVVDENGGVSGIVTLEDLLEELVGDIQDEGDESTSPHILQRDDGSWLMDGSVPIDDVKRVLDLDAFPDEAIGRYDTLAGFVLHLLGHVPQPGATIQWASWRFEVVDMDRLRIDKVLVQSITDATAPSE